MENMISITDPAVEQTAADLEGGITVMRAIRRPVAVYVHCMLATSLALPAWAQNTSPGGAAAADQTAEAGQLQEVVVSGLRQSLESSRALKRDGDAITDSVVAQDIGKLPDQNIAEAAQRIP